MSSKKQQQVQYRDRNLEWQTAPSLDVARERILESLNEAARDVPAMLAAGGHPYQIVPDGQGRLKVVSYPCGRPGCPSCN